MRTVISLLVIAAAAGAARADQLDDILAKNYAARGGDRLHAVRSLRLSGHVRFGGGGGVEAEWAEVIARPGKIRSEVTLQGLTEVEAYDGREGWSMSPFGGRTDPLARGEAELAIRTPRPRQQGLTAVKLARVSTGLYAARSRRRRRRVDGASRGLELLVYVPAWHALQAAAWFQPVLASSRIVLATNSSQVLAAAARAGAGIAVLPRFLADRSLVAVSDDLSAHDHWLVMHPEFRRDPKVQAVASFLRRAAAALA
jgi:hypothetical protein